MSSFNPELVAVSSTLLDCINRLDAKLATATDAHAIKAINLEIIEISHRRTMIGSLIFAEQSDKIRNAAMAVQESKAEIDEAIEEIEKLNKFLKTISSFLALVDNLIDIVK